MSLNTHDRNRGVTAVHIPGVVNDVADALSRDNLAIIRSMPDFYDPNPSIVSPSLLPTAVADSPANGLDLSQLDGVVHFFCSKGIATSTYSTYQSALNKFATFCSQFHIISPFPVHTYQNQYYVTSHHT